MGRAVDADWGAQEELLALLIEVVDLGNRNFYAANSKKGQRQPDPVRVPRPWARRKERRNATPTEVRARFNGPIVHTTRGEQ